MALEYIQPLNLEKIFLQIFAGSLEIFIAMLFLAMCVVAGLFRMSDKVFVLMVILASVMLGRILPTGLFLLVLIIAGISLFWAISRIMKY